MSQPEQPGQGVPGPLVRSDGEPVFDEPWQAQALGLAVSLSERGVFSPAEWSSALGTAHRELIDQGAADKAVTYYEAVAIALERLVSRSSPLTPEVIEERTKAWRRAYLKTPHGAPVELAAGLRNPE